MQAQSDYPILMKNKMRIILPFLLMAMIFEGCGSNYKEIYPRYAECPIENNLTSTDTISCDSVYLRYPYRIAIEDSLAVVLDLHPDTYFLHAFTYPDWRPITSFGQRGKGPEDILSAERVRICSADSIWVLDSNRKQLTRWAVSASAGTASRLEEINLDQRLIRTLDFCKSENGFIVPDYTGNYRYHLLDSRGNIMESCGNIPTEIPVADEHKIALAQAWRSFMDYNPKNNVLAMVTQLGEVIETFNLKTGEHHVLYGPGGEPEFKISQGYGLPIGIMGFTDVQVTEDKIFTIFQGVSMQEIAHNLQLGLSTPDGGRFLYTFSITDLFLHCQKLNHLICGFTITQKEKAIAALDVNKDNSIIYFNLPD